MLRTPTPCKTSRLPPGSWISDASRSTVGLAVEYLSVTRALTFEHFLVRLHVPPAGKALLLGSVSAASLAGGDPELVALAVSAALLDVERHPVLQFESTSIGRDGEHVELDGRLTVKGRTLAVMAAGTLERVTRGRLRLELDTRVDRRQFGLAWNRPGRGGPALGNHVHLHADLTLTARSPECPHGTR